MGTDTRPVDSDGEFPEFDRALSNLRGSGSAFLVIGNVDSATHGLACRRHLGAEGPDATGRILVTRTDREDATATSAVTATSATTASTGRSENRSRVVELATAYRSAAADESDADGPTPFEPGPAVDEPTTTVTDLGELGTETMRAIDAVEPAGGFEPGELRLCFDAVTDTVDRFGEGELFQFLHLLVARVRASDGRLHAHVHGDRDDCVCALFEPLFDGVVELRNRDDEPEQRWHLRDAGVTSEWLSLGV